MQNDLFNPIKETKMASEDNLVEVESATIQGKFYTVDMAKRTCTCPFHKFNPAKLCPHMVAAGVSMDIQIDSYPWMALHNAKKSDQETRNLIKQYDLWLRTRVSKNFILRDFMYSAFGSAMGIHNLPENPDLVVSSAKEICERVCEPVLAHFGRFAITYGYSSRALMQAEWPSLGAKKSSPHNWDRGTFGDDLYARIDILPMCLEDGEVTKEAYGEWMMRNLDIDLLMQWDKSNVLCVTVGNKPRRVWLKWVSQGDGQGGSNKITHWGEYFWQKEYPMLPDDMRPKFGPSHTGGKMFWGS